MYKLCEKRYGSRKRWFMSWVMNKVERCKKLGANVYHKAVVVAGRWYWAKVSPKWCTKACAKRLGDPSTSLKL